MKHESKLKQTAAEQQQAATAQEAGQKVALEFATPEEVLRHDRRNTVVPVTLQGRVQEGVAAEGLRPAKRPWWRRWAGR